MTRLFAYVLWIIQISCLVIIVYCLWTLLDDRAVLALVLASICLGLALYLEHQGTD